MLKPQWIAILLVFTSGTAWGADASKQCYALREEIFVGNESLGFFEAEARLTSRAGSSFVSFWVVMPDSPQVLGGEEITAKSEVPGNYIFRFVDGWNNRSRGSLSVSGRRATLTLEIEPAGETASTISRNYGSYELVQSSCP
jgi:hypothetical protein